MGAVKRALEEREDEARTHLLVTNEVIASLRHGLEANVSRLVLQQPGDGQRWRALYNALDDLEQLVGDFYRPMIEWATWDDEVDDA